MAEEQEQLTDEQIFAKNQARIEELKNTVSVRAALKGQEDLIRDLENHLEPPPRNLGEALVRKARDDQRANPPAASTRFGISRLNKSANLPNVW